MATTGLDVSVYSVLFSESRYEPYVLLADQRYQKLMYISFLSQLVVVPVQQLKQPYSVTFDMKNRLVSSKSHNNLSHLMRLWHFSSSVNSFFKRACAAIQWG